MNTLTYTMPGAASLARPPNLSKEAKRRLSWMDYYRQCGNASKTCRYFGIAPKTFYKWKNRYNPYRLESLEEASRRPKRTRQWEVSRLQELRIMKIRKEYIRHGKEKLKIIYQSRHKESVSSWKIQRVIEKRNLYYSPSKAKRLRIARKRNDLKKRITELKKEKRTGFLVALDTVIRYWAGAKRYILTGIDVHSKIAFARMYSTKHSKNAADFLKRLHYLFDAKIENLQTDNGSEFARHFQEAAKELAINHYFSRPKTPTDNSFNERFNRTLEEEFIQMGNMTADCEVFNQKLTNWLIEYNFQRPNQSLDYQTPIDFHYNYHKVLPMYPSST